MNMLWSKIRANLIEDFAIEESWFYKIYYPNNFFHYDIQLRRQPFSSNNLSVKVDNEKSLTSIWKQALTCVPNMCTISAAHPGTLISLHPVFFKAEICHLKNIFTSLGSR
jgi:hypothetical protein